MEGLDSELAGLWLQTGPSGMFGGSPAEGLGEGLAEGDVGPGGEPGGWPGGKA